MAENDAQAESKPQAHGTLNVKEGSQVHAEYEPTHLYFRPLTGEFIAVPDHEAAEFESHGRFMVKIIADYHEANEELGHAMTAHLEKEDSKNPAERDATVEAVDKASEKVKEKNEKVLEAIKPLDSIAVGGTSIVELIPIHKNKWSGKADPRRGKVKNYGYKFTYVRSDKIKGHWKKTPIAAGNSGPGQANILVKGKDGKAKIDTDRLKNAVRDATGKLELYSDYKYGTLTEWAKSWNEALHTEKPVGQNIDLSAAAQFMRWSKGVGAATEFQPNKGNFAAKAEAKVDFAVAEATGKMEFFLPHRKGIELQFVGKRGTYSLGMFRIDAQIALSGVVGASATLELATEIHIEKDDSKEEKEKGAASGKEKQKLTAKGIPAAKGKFISVDEKSKAIEIAGHGTELTPAKAELGVFAGAKADLDFIGSCQWLNPEGGEHGKKKEFEDFVKINPGFTAMAGVGLEGKLELSYEDGKFHFICKAGFCAVLGVKGKIDATVDGKASFELLKWFFYCLYHANYENLTFVETKTFEVIKNAQFLAIHEGKEIVHFLESSADDISYYIRNVLAALEAPSKRDALASRVLYSANVLKHGTPETKGMLIYQLTRHSKVDWLDSNNYTEMDAFHERKRAIVMILLTVQTSAEWDNVFQHMTRTGGKTAGAAVEQEVATFLSRGRLDMNNGMAAIKARLKPQPTRGYPVALNNSHEYSLQTADHPNYGLADCSKSFGVCTVA